MVTCIRLVIASPSDVAPERDAVVKVASELNRLLGRANDFAIDVYRWETDSGPSFHAEGPQGKIDEDLAIADCDIMVAIFWTRFGRSILAGSETGTEHEINLAFENWKKNGKKPRILIYFKREAPDWDRIDDAQIDRVKAFQGQFRPGGKYQEGKYSHVRHHRRFQGQASGPSRPGPAEGPSQPECGNDAREVNPSDEAWL
jgi:hypothetical protein